MSLQLHIFKQHTLDDMQAPIRVLGGCGHSGSAASFIFVLCLWLGYMLHLVITNTAFTNFLISIAEGNGLHSLR
jgi:hypothetical protein